MQPPRRPTNPAPPGRRNAPALPQSLQGLQFRDINGRPTTPFGAKQEVLNRERHLQAKKAMEQQRGDVNDPNFQQQPQPHPQPHQQPQPTGRLKRLPTMKVPDNAARILWEQQENAKARIDGIPIPYPKSDNVVVPPPIIDDGRGRPPQSYQPPNPTQGDYQESEYADDQQQGVPPVPEQRRSPQQQQHPQQGMSKAVREMMRLARQAKAEGKHHLDLIDLKDIEQMVASGEVGEDVLNEKRRRVQEERRQGSLPDDGEEEQEYERPNSKQHKQQQQREEEKEALYANYSPRYVTTPQVPSSAYIRIQLPSKGLFYDDAPDVQVRKMSVLDVEKMSLAKREGNLSAFYDVIGSCLAGIDVRDLTTGDFYFLIYYMKGRQSGRTPYKTVWKSKYGNENELVINETTLKTVDLKMTREEANRWRHERGIRPPTVRDLEMLQTENVHRDMLWIVERAQYLEIPGAQIMDKVEFLRTAEVEVLEDITEFIKVSRHGVEESVRLRDAHFDPVKWYDRLLVLYESRLARSRDIRIALSKPRANRVDEAVFVRLLEQEIMSLQLDIDDLQQEMIQLQTKIDSGEEILADEEAVTVRITVDSFLSGL